MGSSTKTLLYRYDAVGNRVGLTDGDGGRFTYVYDAVHRLSRVINPQGDRTTFSYDAAGRRREKALANGTRASFTYDLGNRLSRVLNLASGPTTLSSFDYRYDKSGNRTVIIEGGGSSRVTYSYDGASRLVGEHRTGGNPWRNTFSYDSRGNRTLKNETGARTTSVYDAANQLVSSQEAGGRTTYTFDANGNQARVLSPSGDRTTTSWDYENKTTLVRLPAGVRNTMSYNPQGLRVVLADSGGVRKFVWDEEAYLAETDGSDDTQVVYTQEPGLYGRLISQRRGGVISYHHYDGLGSTRRLTNVAQSTTDTYLYDAWGSLVASTGSTINPFRYVGELGYYYDPDTAHSYIRARIYAPPLGRWLSIDPLLFVDGLNLYRAYFVPDKVDPSGLQGWPKLTFHHIFSQQASLVAKLQTLCPQLGSINDVTQFINNYTIPLIGMGAGTAHDFVQYRLNGGRWNSQVENIFDKAARSRFNPCCVALLGVYDLVDTAAQELFISQGGYGPAQRLALTPFRAGDGTNTREDLERLIDNVCNQPFRIKCPPRKPPLLPIPVTVPDVAPQMQQYRSPPPDSKLPPVPPLVPPARPGILDRLIFSIPLLPIIFEPLLPSLPGEDVSA